MYLVLILNCNGGTIYKNLQYKQYHIYLCDIQGNMCIGEYQKNVLSSLRCPNSFMKLLQNHYFIYLCRYPSSLLLIANQFRTRNLHQYVCLSLDIIYTASKTNNSKILILKHHLLTKPLISSVFTNSTMFIENKT